MLLMMCEEKKAEGEFSSIKLFQFLAILEAFFIFYFSRGKFNEFTFNTFKVFSGK